MTPQAYAVQFVAKVNDVILMPLITLLMGIAFIVFLWGCVEYVIHADSESERSKGRQHIMYGLIGLVVMVSAYTIIEIALATFGLNSQLDCAVQGTCTFRVQ